MQGGGAGGGIEKLISGGGRLLDTQECTAPCYIHLI